MKRGDRLIKLDEEESEALHPGLVQVKLKGVEGLVPANYVQPLTKSTDPKYGGIFKSGLETQNEQLKTKEETSEELISNVPKVLSPEPLSYPVYIQRNETQAIRWLLNTDKQTFYLI